MRTKPPCYIAEFDADCPKRHSGCKAECQAWKDFEAAHKAEKEAEYRKKDTERNLNSFEYEQPKRKAQARHREAVKRWRMK